MAMLTLLVFFCASISTMAEASYSNCPKVSLIRPSDVLASRSRSCRGSLLRASTRRNNIPGTPDVNGRKYYSSKTGFFLYVHVMSSGKRFVSIRWAHNPQYALSEENGQLRFGKVTNPQSATPPDKFLFKRLFISPWYQAFRAKASNSFISYNTDNCSVGLTPTSISKTQNHYLYIKCKPNRNRCFCF